MEIKMGLTKQMQLEEMDRNAKTEERLSESVARNDDVGFKEPRKFCNVALLPEDHERLRALAELEQRTMTRQLSVIIRKEYSDM
jgi:hypothetical protein